MNVGASSPLVSGSPQASRHYSQSWPQLVMASSTGLRA